MDAGAGRAELNATGGEAGEGADTGCRAGGGVGSFTISCLSQAASAAGGGVKAVLAQE